MKATILFGHGSRSAEYIRPFESIRAAMLAQRPDAVVELGFLELTQPPLEAVIADLVKRGATHIVVVPIFFAPGKHVLKDLPQLIGNAMDRHPGIEFEVASCVGEVPGVIESMAAFALSQS
jgi:sirohydrochlorin cobaltochelatase